MKALILNSGMGTRMGVLTSEHPKCMTEISAAETILSRQLRQIREAGIREAVITTGYYDAALRRYCEALETGLELSFVKNPLYRETNYIYSIYCAREALEDDILLMHGDLVFENTVLDRVLAAADSCMAVSSACPLPEKDFKAVIRDGRIEKVGIEFFENALAAQPLYKLNKADWLIWLREIAAFCEDGRRTCYAENAFNQVSRDCGIRPLDVEEALCAEVDTPEDLAEVSEKLRRVENRKVYMCFSADVLHSGHMAIIRKAARLGKLTVGVLSDEAVASYKRFPILPAEERRALFSSIRGVERVVEQKTLSYRETLLELRPDIVVHGDNWRQGFQKELRAEVIRTLESYGGRLVEFPYTDDPRLKALEDASRRELSLPDNRRARLRKLLDMKGLVTVMEAHDGLTGLIVENTAIHEQGKTCQFDAMWISSLCDSTAKGKPDIELVDMTSRFRTVDDITEVTTKPIIFDGDTGGMTEHFVYTVRSLEKMGVSAVIIEDKTGLKKNSLFGTEVKQTQDSIEAFSAKIAAGKKAQKSPDFMIIARIESLILERGMEDALTRAFAFVEAGADGIMIHSRKKDPAEIFEFVEKFRARDGRTPLVVVPTSFNSVTEEEFKARGVNIVIYANQLMRSEVPAMRQTAETILRHHRALEADASLMPFSEIIRMIPEDV
ncbi:MAG: phosphoenolpyruvate mutase [Clostridia bacterium]|nr:phosphoenolpyruvate mutase [Clostridia bacterium]